LTCLRGEPNKVKKGVTDWTLLLKDAQTFDLRQEIPILGNACSLHAWSPDSKYLLFHSAGEGQAVELVSAGGGPAVRYKDKFTGCWSPEGDMFVLGSEIRNVAEDKVVQTLEGPGVPNAWRSDGYLAGHVAGRAIYWDSATGKQVADVK